MIHLDTPAFLSNKWCCFPNCTILSCVFCDKNYWQKRIQPALLASIHLSSASSSPPIFLSPPLCARRKERPRSGGSLSGLRSLARFWFHTQAKLQWPPPLLMCLGFRFLLWFWSRSPFLFLLWDVKVSRLAVRSPPSLAVVSEEKPEVWKVTGFLCTLNSSWSWLFLRANNLDQGSFQPQQALSRALGQREGWQACWVELPADKLVLKILSKPRSRGLCCPAGNNEPHVGLRAELGSGRLSRQCLFNQWLRTNSWGAAPEPDFLKFLPQDLLSPASSCKALLAVDFGMRISFGIWQHRSSKEGFALDWCIYYSPPPLYLSPPSFLEEASKEWSLESCKHCLFWFRLNRER